VAVKQYYITDSEEAAEFSDPFFKYQKPSPQVISYVTYSQNPTTFGGHLHTFFLGHPNIFKFL